MAQFTCQKECQSFLSPADASSAASGISGLQKDNPSAHFIAGHLPPFPSDRQFISQWLSFPCFCLFLFHSHHLFSLAALIFLIDTLSE